MRQDLSDSVHGVSRVRRQDGHEIELGARRPGRRPGSERLLHRRHLVRRRSHRLEAPAELERLAERRVGVVEDVEDGLVVAGFGPFADVLDVIGGSCLEEPRLQALTLAALCVSALDRSTHRGEVVLAAHACPDGEISGSPSRQPSGHRRGHVRVGISCCRPVSGRIGEGRREAGDVAALPFAAATFVPSVFSSGYLRVSRAEGCLNERVTLRFARVLTASALRRLLGSGAPPRTARFRAERSSGLGGSAGRSRCWPMIVLVRRRALCS
jgi:hypothetical protein